MHFFCISVAKFSNHNLPDGLLAAMLCRNDNVTLGCWSAVVQGTSVSLKLLYTALAAGVDAANFQLICTLLVKEVAEIEGSLQQKRLL